MRITALGCGHWLKRGDEEDIPDGAACEECGKPVHPLVTWPLDIEGNRVLWHPWPVPLATG